MYNCTLPEVTQAEVLDSLLFTTHFRTEWATGCTYFDDDGRPETQTRIGEFKSVPGFEARTLETTRQGLAGCQGSCPPDLS